MTGVGPGEVTLSVSLLRAGASTQFWRVELSQNGALTNAADIVTSTRRPTDIDYQVEMPTTKSPADSISLPSVNPMAPKWVSHYDQRIAKGMPFAVNESPEAIVWIKEADEAGSDFLLLRVTGATVRNSATDGRAEIWSKSGIMLATSSQIGFFR